MCFFRFNYEVQNTPFDLLLRVDYIFCFSEPDLRLGGDGVHSEDSRGILGPNIHPQPLREVLRGEKGKLDHAD